jgi:hypothetical protein
MLNAPELTYTQRLISGPVVHVDCHIGVDQVQIGGVSRGTVACGTADDGDHGTGRARAIEWAQETWLGVLNTIEAAPLGNGHRRNSGEHKLRRSLQVVDLVSLRNSIDRTEYTTRLSSSPGACRA